MLLAYEDASHSLQDRSAGRAACVVAIRPTGPHRLRYSTLTMQVARLLAKVGRTLWGKLVQMRDAVRLEIAFSKQEILGSI